MDTRHVHLNAPRPADAVLAPDFGARAPKSGASSVGFNPFSTGVR